MRSVASARTEFFCVCANASAFGRAGRASAGRPRRCVETNVRVRVVVNRIVECPFSATIEFAAEELERSPEVQVSPLESAGESVRLASSVVEDATDAVRKHDALAFAWRARHRGLFPDLHGTLTVRPSVRGSELTLAGQYTPPFGAAGKLFDTIAGHAIARRTLDRFLGHVAQRVESRWQQEPVGA